MSCTLLVVRKLSCPLFPQASYRGRQLFPDAKRHHAKALRAHLLGEQLLLRTVLDCLCFHARMCFLQLGARRFQLCFQLPRARRCHRWTERRRAFLVFLDWIQPEPCSLLRSGSAASRPGALDLGLLVWLLIWLLWRGLLQGLLRLLCCQRCYPGL